MSRMPRDYIHEANPRTSLEGYHRSRSRVPGRAEPGVRRSGWDGGTVASLLTLVKFVFAASPFSTLDPQMLEVRGCQ